MSKLAELPVDKVPVLGKVKCLGRSLAQRTRERNFHRMRLAGVGAALRFYGLPASAMVVTHRRGEFKLEQRLDKHLTLIYREWIATNGPAYGAPDWDAFYHNAMKAAEKERIQELTQ